MCVCEFCVYVAFHLSFYCCVTHRITVHQGLLEWVRRSYGETVRSDGTVTPPRVPFPVTVIVSRPELVRYDDRTL